MKFCVLIVEWLFFGTWMAQISLNLFQILVIPLSDFVFCLLGTNWWIRKGRKHVKWTCFLAFKISKAWIATNEQIGESLGSLRITESRNARFVQQKIYFNLLKTLSLLRNIQFEIPVAGRFMRKYHHFKQMTRCVKPVALYNLFLNMVEFRHIIMCI